MERRCTPRRHKTVLPHTQFTKSSKQRVGVGPARTCLQDRLPAATSFSMEKQDCREREEERETCTAGPIPVCKVREEVAPEVLIYHHVCASTRTPEMEWNDAHALIGKQQRPAVQKTGREREGLGSIFTSS